LIAPIAMSDGAGPGTEFAATTDASGPAMPTSNVKLLLTLWPSNWLTVVQLTVYTPVALVASGIRISSAAST
jgi:hypothetical protein